MPYRPPILGDDVPFRKSRKSRVEITIFHKQLSVSDNNWNFFGGK